MNMKFPVAAFLFSLLAALPVSAGEADERNMGDDAFSRHDYPGAVRFYRKALLLAQGERWSEDALLLARAQLRSGDVAGAEKTYAEYRKRNPQNETAAGMFPGELMLAAKNYTGAALYFSRLGTESIIPDEQRNARFAAAAAFAAGGEYLTAEKLFSDLEKNYIDSPEWAAQAHLGMIGALLDSGQFDRAERFLAERKYFRESPDKYHYFELYRAVKMRDFKLFYTLWKKLPQNFDAQLHCKLALMGADLAQRSPATLPESAELLRTAYRIAGDDDTRKHALRKLINVESINSVEEAVKAIELYLKTWQDDPEVQELRLRQARLLVSLRKYVDANTIFAGLIADKATPHNLRLTAIREAAVSAEYYKDFLLAEQFLQKFMIHAANNVEREEALFLLGELLLKQKQNFRAEEYFRAALEQGGIRTPDIQFRLLETLIGEEKFDKAAEMALQLGKASQGVHRAASAYYLAYIESRRGDAAEARKKFLGFLKEFPWSGYVQPSAFHAAKLAFHNRDFKTAADELLAFTGQYPDSKFNDAALLLAIQSACISQDLQLAEKIIAQYDKLLPASSGKLEARLLLADTLYRLNRRNDTLELLKKTRAMAQKNPVVTAEILYQYARIALAEEDKGKALQYLGEILKEYSKISPLAADAAFISGNLLADQGKYAEAETAYRKALEFQNTGTFALLCEGRLADALFGRYSAAPDEELLEQITNLYRKLAAAPDYRVRLQSCCKLGRVLEMAGRNREAFTAYQEALYISANLKRQRLAADPVWTGKAAQAALNLCQKQNFPDRALHVKRITAQMRELNIPLNVGDIENNDQDKFTIQEK